MKERLQAALKDAMRARATVKLNTIRSLMSALEYEEVQRGAPLDSSGTTEIIKRELKKRKEELEFVEKANRPEELTALKEEMALLETFLPQQLGDSELEKLITDLKGADPTINMGGVMKVLKERHAGQYDAKKASELAKRIAG